MPSQCQRQREDLENRLTEAEATSAPPPWTYKSLVSIIAHHILQQAGRDKHVNNADVTDDASKKCAACAKPGHAAQACPTTCTEPKCKERACPGNRGKACMLTWKKFPKSVRNAYDRPVPDAIYKRLKTKYESVHAGRHVNQAEVDDTESVDSTADAAKSTNVLTQASPEPAVVNLTLPLKRSRAAHMLHTQEALFAAHCAETNPTVAALEAHSSNMRPSSSCGRAMA